MGNLLPVSGGDSRNLSLAWNLSLRRGTSDHPHLTSLVKGEGLRLCFLDRTYRSYKSYRSYFVACFARFPPSSMGARLGPSNRCRNDR